MARATIIAHLKETIDSYIHNCYVLQSAMERLYAFEHQQMTKPCDENSRLTKMYPNGMFTVDARHFEVYIEKKEAIIALFLNAKDKQSLNTELTKLIPSSQIPALYKAFKEFIKNLPSTKAKSKVDKKKREAQFRSVYGQHFKKGVYKEKREKIISILVNATSRQQVNSELCKILPGENVSKIIKQFQPLLKDLP